MQNYQLFSWMSKRRGTTGLVMSSPLSNSLENANITILDPYSERFTVKIYNLIIGGCVVKIYFIVNINEL